MNGKPTLPIRKIVLRAVPIAVAAPVAFYGSEALADPGTTRTVVMLVLFAVTLLIVGFAVDAIEGDRNR